MLWFTADTHFGHDAIRLYCQRPFDSVEEMDDELIRRWNAVVHVHDTVWHLGDFCFHTDPWQYLSQLNGTIWMCLGNHDKRGKLSALLGRRIFDVRYIRWEGKRFFCSHYAHRTWPKIREGCLHLYGHSHGRLTPLPRSMDVGVDLHQYRPISAVEVLDFIWQDTAAMVHAELEEL